MLFNKSNKICFVPDDVVNFSSIRWSGSPPCIIMSGKGESLDALKPLPGEKQPDLQHLAFMCTILKQRIEADPKDVIWHISKIGQA